MRRRASMTAILLIVALGLVQLGGCARSFQHRQTIDGPGGRTTITSEPSDAEKASHIVDLFNNAYLLKRRMSR